MDAAVKTGAAVICPHSQSICSQRNLSNALDGSNGHAGLVIANIQVTGPRVLRASVGNLHPRGATGRIAIENNTPAASITSSIRDKERTFGSRRISEDRFATATNVISAATNDSRVTGSRCVLEGDLA